MAEKALLHEPTSVNGRPHARADFESILHVVLRNEPAQNECCGVLRQVQDESVDRSTVTQGEDKTILTASTAQDTGQDAGQDTGGHRRRR